MLNSVRYSFHRERLVDVDVDVSQNKKHKGNDRLFIATFPSLYVHLTFPFTFLLPLLRKYEK